MARAWRGEERAMWKLVGKGSRKGSSPLSRAADVMRHPLTWGGFAVALSLTGPRGRRGALRGALCAGTSSLIHLALKPVFGRRRPWGAHLMRAGPFTSSFPSGHTSADLGFLFGAAQELPVLLVPLSCATLGSHWSLVRSRSHYPSDIVAGGALAFAVAAVAWKLWPPGAQPAPSGANVAYIAE